MAKQDKPQMRPSSREQAPDPANSYERTDPSREAGMGELDNDEAIPSDQPDRMHHAVSHKQDGARQLNGDDAAQPDKPTNEEEPLNEDPAS